MRWCKGVGAEGLPWFDESRRKEQSRSAGLTHCPPSTLVAGTLLRKSWGADRATQLEPISIPCQSTGLFYLQPRPNVERFMLALVDRLVREETWHEWDQATWNVVIVPCLIGSGDSDLPPLRYRLLPHAEYANIHVVERRRQAGKRADVVIMHLGGVHGRDKVRGWMDEALVIDYDAHRRIAICM